MRRSIRLETLSEFTLHNSVLRFELTGSSAICPSSDNKDLDFVVLVNPDFSITKPVGFYLKSDENPNYKDLPLFTVYCKDNVDIICTKDAEFYDKFVLATRLATKLSLVEKADRIALFRGILYNECK